MHLLQELPDRFLEFFPLYNFSASTLFISLFYFNFGKNILLILSEKLFGSNKPNNRSTNRLCIQSTYSNAKQTTELLIINLFEGYEYL